MPLTVGQVLQDNYLIIDLLGKGGMGAVYLAEHTRLSGRLLAIKENTPNPFADPATLAQLRDQFYTEAKILATLVHPVLPQVSDYFSEGGVEYLVMDYVEGETLQEVSERHLQQHGKPLPEKLVVAWADEVLSALEYMHSRQPDPVIHRDIKPSNLILTPEGKIRLVDFGLAKLMTSGQSTATGVRGMGTPDYTPLEQFPGSQSHTDARTDIYSLGATLYDLLAGAPPINVRDRLLGTAQLPPLRQLNPAVSPATERAIHKAIEIQPGQRFQTAAQMRSMLLSQSEAKKFAPAASSHQRHWAVPGLAALLLVALLAVGALSAWNRQSAAGPAAILAAASPNPKLAVPGAISTSPADKVQAPSVLSTTASGGSMVAAGVLDQATPTKHLPPTATRMAPATASPTPQPSPTATATQPKATGRAELTPTNTPRVTATTAANSAAYPDSPALLGPADGEIAVAEQVFNWRWAGPPLGGDERFDWRLLRDPGGESVVEARSLTESQVVYRMSDLPAGDYYWSVRVIKVGPAGKLVSVRSLETPRRRLRWNPSAQSDTAVPSPTDTPEEPTDTPEPKPTDTPVPEPTDTPEPLPTDTPEPLPTDTPEPVPTDTPEPMPTEPPVSRASELDLGPNVVHTGKTASALGLGGFAVFIGFAARKRRCGREGNRL